MRMQRHTRRRVLPSPYPRWSTAPLWRVNGDTTGLLSIGPLLILYWSCIGPLLVGVFGRPPAPGGRDEGAGSEHPQLVHPAVHLLPHADKHLRAFQRHLIPLVLELPPFLELLQVQLREVDLPSFRRRPGAKKSIQGVLVHPRRVQIGRA